MKRSRQLFLGFPSPTRPMTEDEYLPLEAVSLTSAVRFTLTRQIQVLGRWQGGALFGELVAGSLTVQLTAPLAPPGWKTTLLMLHLPYLLGWSDCIETQASKAVDWYGNWVSAPDGRLPDQRADLTWLAWGGRQGLFDEQHGLVVLGLEDGILRGRAYRWEEGHPMAVECHLMLTSQDL